MAATDEYENNLPVQNTGKYIRALAANGDPILIPIEEVAKVVGGLIGTATPEKNGLMPAYKTYTSSYIVNTVYVLVASVGHDIGVSLIVSVIKNHELSGNSIAILTGFHGGCNAKSVIKGSYLQKLYYIEENNRLNIYVKPSIYTYTNAFLIGNAGSSNDISLKATIVTSLPTGAIEIPIS